MPAETYIDAAREILAAGLPIGPRMHPCVCGEGRHAHAGKNRTGACKAVDCRKYRADMAWQYAYDALDAQAMSLGQSIRAANRLEREAHYKANPRKPGEWSIGASDTGTCTRKLYYRNLPPADLVRAWEDTREADAGTMLHDEITAKFERLYPWRIFKLRLRMPGFDRDVELDAYDPITGEVEDFKTAGRTKWEWIGDDGPTFETWEQVMFYGLVLEEHGYHVTTVRLSYYHREKGWDETHVRPYDREMAEAARDRLLGHMQSLDMLSEIDPEDPVHDELLEELLPRTGTGPASDELCRRCFARNHCWSIVQAEAAGRSPESYTVLGAEPEDPTIAFHISERIRTREERIAAEKAEEIAKTLLVGVEPGRYGEDGEFEGYEKWGGGGDDKAKYADTLAELFHLPDGMRPALDDIPMPQKRRYSYTQWGKTRKAVLDKERKERAALDKAEKQRGAA